MAIIDADEKPVSCEFIGCNGNVAPYLIGATTNIKPLEQESILDKIRAEIENTEISGHISNVECFSAGVTFALKIIDKYKAKIEGNI